MSADLLSDIPRRIVDPASSTVKELADQTLHSARWMRDFTAEKVRVGTWEPVWKSVKGRLVRSYRRTKH